MAAGKGSKGRKRQPARRPTTSSAGRRPGTGSTGSAGSAGSPGRAAGAAGGAGADRGPAEQKPGSQPARTTGPSGRTKPTRTERLEAARRARRRKKALVRAGVAGAVALLVLVAVFVVGGNRRDASANRERLTAGSCSFDTESDPTSAPPNNHVAPSSYKVDPPAGGNHAPQAAAAGLYGDQGRPAPSGPQLVHALEHGYVVVWHRPDLDEKELTAVRGVSDRYPNDVLVVPRASLQQKAAATAWGRRLLCPEIEAARLTDFVRLYRNEGPEKVPHT